MIFFPTHPLLPMSTCYLHPQVIQNRPLRANAGFNITAETPKTFRRFERTETDDMKNEIILETKRNINIHFQKEVATFKKNGRK